MPNPRTWLRLAQAQNKKEAAAINEKSAMLDLEEEYQGANKSPQQAMATKVNQLEPGYISQAPPDLEPTNPGAFNQEELSRLLRGGKPRTAY